MSKYDCSKCLDYIHEEKRICAENKCECGRCVFRSTYGYCYSPDSQKKIDIVQKLSDEHPEKTILEDFKEKYPNCILNDEIPTMCVRDLYSTKKCPPINSCFDCWNRPLSEVMR